MLWATHSVGQGVPKIPGALQTLYQKACDGGHAGACYNLGLQSELGHGRDRDLVRANRLFEQACDGDNYGGCQRLAEHTRVGRGVTQNPERAASLYQKACDGGALGACTAQGLNYRYGHTVTRDHAKANALFKRASDGGHASGCIHLGVSYEYGMGVETDVETAKTLYTEAFKVRQTSCNTDGGACERWQLAQLFERGRGVAQSTARAQAIYREALTLAEASCAEDDYSSCELAGRIHAQGLHGSTSLKTASPLLEKARTQGWGPRVPTRAMRCAPGCHIPSAPDGNSSVCEGLPGRVGIRCHQLGETHRLGRDTPTDVTQAASAFSAAVRPSANRGPASRGDSSGRRPRRERWASGPPL